jgi:hypothetical protein
VDGVLRVGVRVRPALVVALVELDEDALLAHRAAALGRELVPLPLSVLQLLHILT